MSLPARQLVEMPAHPSGVHLAVVRDFAPELPDSLGLGDRLRSGLMILAHTHVLMAGAAAVGTWIVQVLTGLPMAIEPCLSVFLVFFSIYTLDRVAAEPETDAINHPERERFSRRHARELLGLACTAYVIALALAARGGVVRFLVMLLPLVAVLAYSFPFVPRPLVQRLGFRRIKEILLAKNAVVAGTFAVTLTLASLPAEGGADFGRLALVGGFLFLRYFINAVVFDIRDEHGDRFKRIRTLPVVLGSTRTRRLLHVLNGVLGLYLIVVPALGIAPASFSALAVGAPLAMWYLGQTGQQTSLHFLCDVVVDGELYVAGLALLLTLGLA